MNTRIVRCLAGLLICLWPASHTFAQYQLTNPGFENWDGTASSARPLGWSSFPQADGSYASLASTAQHAHRTGGRPGTAGSSFVTIWTRSVFGIKANGNMTTGQIHAGAMSASSSDNYNYTHRGSTYCHTFSGTPDSMYVWVSFYAASSSSTAAVRAYIHGNNDFRDANDVNDATLYKGKAVAQFTPTTSNASSRTWVQQKVPFVYDGFSSVNYILMSMTTNVTPGGGAANDSLSVDDIEFIYSAWLDNISINWDSIDDFQRGRLDYTDTVATYSLLQGSTVQFSPQASDATVTVDTLWLNSHTRQFQLHVLAEDSVTTRTYTVTLVGPEPPCDTVSDIQAQVFSNRVNVSWTPGTHNSAYEVEYGPEGFAQGSGTLLSVTDHALLIDSLEYATTYQLYVRAICRDTVYTDWCGPVSFTTDTMVVTECPPPTDLTLDTVTLTSASFHWTVVMPPDTNEVPLPCLPPYDVCLMQGADTVSHVQLADGEDHYTVDSLLPGTAYTLAVSTICRCSSGELSQPALLSFVTLRDTVGIALPETMPSLTLYPNPATDVVTVECAEPVESVVVYNAQGHPVRRCDDLTATRPAVSLRGLAAGVYLVTVHTARGTASQRVTLVR